jgi:hypothetical protein
MSIQAMSWVLENSGHGGSELLVMIVIANHCHSDGTGAYPSIETIAEEARMSTRGVQYVIQRLLDAPDKELVIEPDAGPFGSNLYSIPGVKRDGFHTIGRKRLTQSLRQEEGISLDANSENLHAKPEILHAKKRRLHAIAIAPESNREITVQPSVEVSREDFQILDEEKPSQDQYNFKTFKIKFMHLTGLTIFKSKECEELYAKRCHKHGEPAVLESLEDWVERKGGKKGFKNFYSASLKFLQGECEDVILALQVVEKKKEWVGDDPFAPKPGEEDSKRRMEARRKKDG